MIIFFSLILTLFLSNGVIAVAGCDLSVALLNQEPYPAVPGDILKLVFQISGIDSSECEDVNVELLEEFPFTLDPSSSPIYNIQSGTYTRDYSSTFMAPFKVRVDEDALDGETPIKLKYQNLEKTFDIEIRDIRANFEIFVDDFDTATNTITFEILNTGSEDIEAVTIEIPNQNGIKVYGPNRENIGDLSSNEATTSEFKLLTKNDSLNLTVHYSDVTNTRRTVNQNIKLDLGNFDYPKEGKNNSNFWIIAAIIVIIAFFVARKKYRKNKKV